MFAPGANPVDKGTKNPPDAGPRQGWEPAHSLFGPTGWVQQGKWVCEEIQTRYKFMQVNKAYLKQDFIRPSSRYGAGMRLTYTDKDSRLLIGKCNYSSYDIYYPKVTGIDRRVHWEVPCPQLLDALHLCVSSLGPPK